jgi:4-hydroxybenzoate polyprenyltransferase
MSLMAMLQHLSRARRWFEFAGGLVRIEQWWTFKLMPPLVVAYASCLRLGIPLASRWSELLWIVAAIGAFAACVSCLNDLFDKADDARAGKHNRMQTRTPRQVARVVALPLSVVAASVWHWWDRPAVLVAEALLVIVFCSYSVPPLRLKCRGAAGAAADAIGAHVLPALIALLAIEPDAPVAWLLATSAWAGALGLRGIIWHQLQDHEADEVAGVRTLIMVHSPRFGRLLATWIVLPVEMLALAAVLRLIGNPWPVFALICYALVLLAKMKRFGTRPVIVTVQPRYTIFLFDYYLLLWPLSLLVAAATRWPADWRLLLAHLLLFPGLHREFARVILLLVRR